MDSRLWMHKLLGVQGWKTPVGRKEARVETPGSFHQHSARKYNRKHCKIFTRHPAHPSHPKVHFHVSISIAHARQTSYSQTDKSGRSQTDKFGRSQTAKSGRSQTAKSGRSQTAEGGRS